MARLPTVGGDNGNWGTVLNEFLSVVHESDGTLKSSGAMLVAASDAPTDIKNVANYICDGTADKVEINLAITAIATLGGKVVLSEGHFYTAAAISVSSNITIEGQGWATIITTVGTGFYGIVNSSQTTGNAYITIRDLKIDFSSVAATHEAVRITVANVAVGSVDYCSVDRVWTVCTPTLGLAVQAIYLGGVARTSGTNLCHGPSVTNCRVQGAPAAGIRVRISDIATVEGNTTDNCNWGIYIQGSTQECTVRGNFVYNSNQSGIAVESSKRTIVVANVVNGVTLFDGIHTELSSEMNLIIGNFVTATTRHGIEVIGGPTPPSGQSPYIIANNLCWACGEIGIIAAGGSSSGTTMNYIVINGNNCTENGDEGIFLRGWSYSREALLEVFQQQTKPLQYLGK